MQFEITEPTREAVGAWINSEGLSSDQALFPSRLRGSTHLSTRQYARIVGAWVKQIGLNSTVRYLGIEVGDALEMAEQTEV